MPLLKLPSSYKLKPKVFVKFPFFFSVFVSVLDPELFFILPLLLEFSTNSSLIVRPASQVKSFKGCVHIIINPHCLILYLNYKKSKDLIVNAIRWLEAKHLWQPVTCYNWTNLIFSFGFILSIRISFVLYILLVVLYHSIFSNINLHQVLKFHLKSDAKVITIIFQEFFSLSCDIKSERRYC